MAIEERKEREREKLRELILGTAEKIISEEGLEKLSIRKIANRIEYSPAIIYHYFRDKDDVVNQIMTNNYQKIVSALGENEVQTRSPEEKLKAMTKNYIYTALSMSDYYLMAQLSRSKEIQKYIAFMYEGASKNNQALIMLCECLRDINCEKKMSEGEVELIAQIIVSATLGLVIKLIVEDSIGAQQRERLIDRFVKNALLKIAGGKTV